MDVVNDEILVTVQIETKEAVENIEEIVSVEGVDATFIGPSDLSASMGVRGQFWHPEVVKEMGKVVEACDAAGVAPGIAFGRDLEHRNELIEQGFRFIGVGGDSRRHFAGAVRTIRDYFAVYEADYWAELLYNHVDEREEIEQHSTALQEAFDLGRRAVEEAW